MKLAESFQGTCWLLLTATLYFSLQIFRGLSSDERLLLRCLHLPDDQRRVKVGLCLQGLVLGAGDVARLDGEHHGVHEVLGGLDEGGGGVEAGDDELPRHVLDISLHLGGDVELVAVERDPLQVRDQVLLGRRLGALVCYRSEIL